ncbi:hypothetical protein AVEN_126032-1 [Araneus ventricosus]|uniref:Uncharacterized protein n=1 Tax=Araneus ventricosus TaxID=182803 RepID=A0A4Y2QBX7_ARAVE|nr:hypothetical protein AVEN_126032-1 [Araneus ventricosus]
MAVFIRRITSSCRSSNTKKCVLCAHRECSVAMLVDEREHIQELGYRRILKARETAPKKTIRNFVPLKINFQASDYIEIINWNSCVVYPPPILRDVSEDYIKSLINSDTKPIREIQNFPCRTQALERCVK